MKKKQKGEQKMETKFEYYTGTEYTDFAIIPKCLFTEPQFKEVSYGAKLLYSFLLDRMSLSVKNGWVDKDKRTYIYFSVESVMEYFNIGKNKAIDLFKELDTETGCGLIYKKKQGLGKPARIYVMDCPRPKKCGKLCGKIVEKCVENFFLLN